MTKSERRELKRRKRQEKIEAKVDKAHKKIKKGSHEFWADFKKFAVKGNIVDLAIAVVIGAAFNKMVNTLVSSIITPLTSMLLPEGTLTDMKLVLREGVEENVEAGIEAVSEVALTYGLLLQAMIDFMVIALSLFVVIKTFLKLKNAINRKEREAAEEKARLAEEKKKAAAAEEAEKQAKIRREFIEDVSVQADILTEMRDIMLRFEKKLDEKNETSNKNNSDSEVTK